MLRLVFKNSINNEKTPRQQLIYTGITIRLFKFIELSIF